ncbi:MAG: methenyltetrahydromethanopterin cyclohydrolase, partial [Methanobacterium sp.]
MVSVNLEAQKTVDLMIKNADELNLGVERLENDSIVIDAGVNVPGSLKAGELYTKV